MVQSHFLPTQASLKIKHVSTDLRHRASKCGTPLFQKPHIPSKNPHPAKLLYNTIRHQQCLFLYLSAEDGHKWCLSPMT